jgi:hypothetical protein
MIAHTPRGLRRRLTSAGLVATTFLLVSALTPAPSQAEVPSPDECATLAQADEKLAALCLSSEQFSTLDDTAADLPVDAISSSPNMRLVANLPKPAPFNTVPAFNSDIAFQGNYAFSGNYEGFVIFDIRNPHRPSILSQVLCPGSQNDISIFGDLLFLSTDSSRSDDSCASTSQSATNPLSWEGIKIFDISNKQAPRYVKSVETKCGSHTHTLVPGNDRQTVYVYVSSYNPSLTFPDCQPPHDLISIIKVPVRNPTEAAVVAAPNLFPDQTGNPGGNGSRETSGCHDITSYPAKRIAAGACMGDGILMDVSNPEAPRVINRVRDLVNFSFWHSATFNQWGTKVVFTDELGGGTGPTCNPTIGPTRGADAIYDIVGHGDNRTMEFRSYFKIPRTNTNFENCVAHNGSVVPVLFGDVMVQAWYQGGISVWDFTDSRNPKEIGFWERGPLSDTELVPGGSWSAYYYNGHIYSNDIQKGLDVIELRDWRTWTASLVRLRELNVQTQPVYWSLFS